MSLVTGMPVSREKPPCYEAAKKFFNLKEGQGTVFTYGNVIYNPDGVPMSDDLIVHEEVHGHQQGHNDTEAGLWWKRAIADPQFLLEQETEAYAQQYKFLCTRSKNREWRAKNLYGLAKMLSSEMYGNIVTQAEAAKLIRDLAK